MRILFLCDIHGSEILFDKVLTAVSKYEVNALILSGDLAGKDIRPIILENEKYVVEINGEKQSFSKNEIEYIKNKLSGFGHYYFYSSISEQNTLSEQNILKILDDKILNRIDTWINRIINKIDLNKITVLITPGNDDIFEIDDLINSYERNGINNCSHGPVRIGKNEIITLDYSNITPWQTIRENSEKSLKKIIDDKLLGFSNFNNAIFNFHCPPYNTKLDIAPEIDKNFRYVVSPVGIKQNHVGSKAIRTSIEQYQPLLSLHGHIHESTGFDYIGKTLCLNPGSEFDNGMLKAYIIDIDIDGKLKNFNLIEE